MSADRPVSTSLDIDPTFAATESAQTPRTSDPLEGFDDEQTVPSQSQTAAQSRSIDSDISDVRVLEHEINTPLTIITCYASLLLKDPKSPDMVRKIIEAGGQISSILKRAKGAIQRGLRINTHALASEIKRHLKVIADSTVLLLSSLEDTESLSTLHKIIKANDQISSILLRAENASDSLEAPKFIKISLSGALKDVVELWKTFKELDGVRFRLEIDNGVDVIWDPTNLNEVLNNLMQNAFEAAKNHSDEPEVVVTLHVHPDGFARIYIRDNGPGIQPKHEARISQRGFTTKQGGHGIGVWRSRELVEKAGGKLTLKNCENAPGAIAIIELPACKEITRPGATAEIAETSRTAVIFRVSDIVDIVGRAESGDIAPAADAETGGENSR